MYNVKLSDIIIPEEFAKTTPKQYKIDAVMKYVKENGILDKPLIISNDMVLTDNYIRYLVAKNLEMKEVLCISTEEYKKNNPESNQTISYIVGKFYGHRKQYIWQNPTNIPIQIGDRVLVYSKKKKGVVTVINTFKSNNPNLLRHKSIIKVLNKWNE